MQTDLDAAALLQFFTEHGRTLPWRGVGATPWRVLVSEVMLQQTPVARVVPVFDEWLRRWPTPSALAAEPSGEAIRAWGRLGYPRRALRLWQAATVIDRDFEDAVPDDLDALLSLPGVGQYTARAVLAFGFRRRIPVVDTNVRRVVHRCVLGSDDAGPATVRDLAVVDALLPGDEPTSARLSAALMELGALVCVAGTPRCERCPLRPGCRWVAAGMPPGTLRRKAQPWQGTDRQLRGRLLGMLRASERPLPIEELRFSDVDARQWARCLESLVADGLAEVGADGSWSLPGRAPAMPELPA